MKRILLITTLFVVAISTANAQFRLIPNGLVSINNPDNNYIVEEFEGKNKEELYNAVNVYLHSVYVSPQDVVSAVKNEAITINGISEQAILTKDKSIAGRVKYDIKYTISLAFKDGKIKINTPHIISMKRYVSTISSTYSITGSWLTSKCVFNKKGKVLDKIGKKSIEDFFNSYISKIKTHIIEDKKTEGDDW